MKNKCRVGESRLADICNSIDGRYSLKLYLMKGIAVEQETCGMISPTISEKIRR